MVVKFARKFMFLAKIPLDATAFSVRIVVDQAAAVNRHGQVFDISFFGSEE